MSEHPPELVEKVRDELAGWPVGNGYYGTEVGTDEALGMARAVLDAITETCAVVELPEPQPGWWDCYEEDGDEPDHTQFSDQDAEFFVTTWRDHPGEIQISHHGEPLEPIRPMEARSLAAALLAAARAAEADHA